MKGSFVKKRGRTWTAYYYVTTGPNRRQRSKGGFATKQAAADFLAEQVGEVRRGNHVEPSRLRFREYLTEHWLPLVKHSIRESTWNSYEHMLTNHVVPTLGGIYIQELTAADLDRLYTRLLEHGRLNGKGGLSPKTVRYIHTTVHRALRDAERKQLVYRNVAHAADAPPQRRDGSQLHIWSGEEVAIFLQALEDHPMYAAYLLAASTGMRRGEVLGLRWRDVDLRARRVSIRQSITCVNYRVVFGEPKTARSRRSIAIDSTTAEALEDDRKAQAALRASVDAFDDQDLVFCRLEGGPIHPDYFSQTFDRTVARLRLRRIRLHDLRHTHATLGLAAGIPPKVMSDRLGHATVAFTQDVYMHAIPQLEADAADQIADLIFPSRTNVVALPLTNSGEDEKISDAPGRLPRLAGWSSGSSLGS